MIINLIVRFSGRISCEDLSLFVRISHVDADGSFGLFSLSFVRVDSRTTRRSRLNRVAWRRPILFFIIKSFLGLWALFDLSRFGWLRFRFLLRRTYFSYLFGLYFSLRRRFLQNHWLDFFFNLLLWFLQRLGLRLCLLLYFWFLDRHFRLVLNRLWLFL